MSIEIYDQYYPKKLGFKEDDFSKVVDFFQKRTTERYIIKGIIGIDIVKGQFYFTMDVQEPEAVGKSTEQFYMPKHTIIHLFNFLNIPTTTLNYFQTLNTDLTESQRADAFKAESNHLANLFNNRLDRQKERKSIKDIYLHIVNDDFGRYPRAVTSDDYVWYEDKTAITEMDDAIKQVGLNTKREYRFYSAILTPFSTRLGYISDIMEIVGEEVAKGISWLNSEMKRMSFQLQNLVMRLICTNGLYTTIGEGDRHFRIPHKGENFGTRQAIALNNIVALEDKFTENYKILEKFSQKVISDNWADLYELPPRYLSMKKNEKAELIEIAEAEKYPFNPYGLVQALTYKASHKTASVSEMDRLNDKANRVILDAKAISSWKPTKAEVSA